MEVRSGVGIFLGSEVVQDFHKQGDLLGPVSLIGVGPFVEVFDFRNFFPVPSAWDLVVLSPTEEGA